MIFNLYVFFFSGTHGDPTNNIHATWIHFFLCFRLYFLFNYTWNWGDSPDNVIWYIVGLNFYRIICTFDWHFFLSMFASTSTISLKQWKIKTLFRENGGEISFFNWNFTIIVGGRGVSGAKPIIIVKIWSFLIIFRTFYINSTSADMWRAAVWLGRCWMLNEKWNKYINYWYRRDMNTKAESQQQFDMTIKSSSRWWCYQLSNLGKSLLLSENSHSVLDRERERVKSQRK